MPKPTASGSPKRKGRVAGRFAREALAGHRRPVPAPATAAGGGRGGGNLRFGIVVDGYALPATVNEIFAQGKQNDVPTVDRHQRRRGRRGSAADDDGTGASSVRRGSATAKRPTSS